jgi:hypothetical protein
MRACVGGLRRPVSRLPQLPKAEVEAQQRTEQIAQIRDYFAQLHQVDTVAFRIRTANKADCKAWVSAQIGLYAVTPQSLPRRYRSFAREAPRSPTRRAMDCRSILSSNSSTQKHSRR